VATSPGPSAIIMAVSNAIGRWLHEYPATPERVLAALGTVSCGEKKRGGA
jgi:CO/xanthine dehydrogenase Mo-binding subunit